MDPISHSRISWIEAQLSLPQGCPILSFLPLLLLVSKNKLTMFAESHIIHAVYSTVLNTTIHYCWTVLVTVQHAPSTVPPPPILYNQIERKCLSANHPMMTNPSKMLHKQKKRVATTRIPRKGERDDGLWMQVESTFLGTFGACAWIVVCLFLSLFEKECDEKTGLRMNGFNF